MAHSRRAEASSDTKAEISAACLIVMSAQLLMAICVFVASVFTMTHGYKVISVIENSPSDLALLLIACGVSGALMIFCCARFIANVATHFITRNKVSL